MSTNSAGKRAREADDDQLSKRVRPHDTAVEVNKHAATVSTYTVAPRIECSAVLHGEILKISTEQYIRDSNLVVLFYDYDFTPTAVRDILAFSSRHQDITGLNANIVAISADTEHCHYAFIERAFGGSDVPIPLLADTTKRIAHSYQVLDECKGVAKRSVFVIDKLGHIRFWSVLQHLELEHNVNTVISVLKHLP
ncbi:hypothetical protein NQZ79_g1580 [Umbelopsis isabellina]|nr:hypothetical protein NQZ79_g1580 [Umbelopsis isabellina]